MDEKIIKKIVKETIEELKRSGLLKNYDESAYAEISSVLYSYYEDGEADTAITKALDDLDDDPYLKIIPLYFDYKYTIEKIAEVYDVEVSTITRNKKRLCLEIYKKIQ